MEMKELHCGKPYSVHCVLLNTADVVGQYKENLHCKHMMLQYSLNIAIDVQSHFL